ncbi:MAG: hypothetical protein U0637_06765 [Phycisphaerales bacterium]
MEFAPGETRSIIAIREPFSVQAVPKCIEREWFVRVEVKETPDVRRSCGINFGNAAALFADVSEPIGGFANEPAFLNSPGKALSHIDGLLLGVEARHVGERSTHHAAGGVALCGLRDGNERESVLALQAFKFDVIEQVTGSAIDFVEQKPVELFGMLLRERDQLFERFSLVRLARSLCDAKQTHNLAAGEGRVSLEGVLLHRQRKALALLLS